MKKHLVRFEPRFSFVANKLAPVVRWEAALVALMMLGITLGTPSRTSAAVPSGFTDSLVASIDAPTDITFTPGGRLVVSSQGGILRVRNNDGSLTTMLNLTSKICSDFERGLLGVTFDPQFSTNPYIYVFYTFNKHGTCVDNSSSSPVNRVSRFTVSGNTASGEVVLVDNMPSPNGNHNAGDLLFGKDGFLYIGIGDGGCDLSDSTKCAGANTNARKTHILSGKVLRVDRNGNAPSANPFPSGGTCRTTGSTTAGQHCRETYAWGFRNPFRLALDPKSSTTRIYVNDVGQGTWEEVNLLVAGSDYGWNDREGFCARGSTSGCSTGSTISGYRNPVHAYGRSAGCASITGGAFVPNGVWPSTYNGAYLYADYVCGRIYSLNGSSATLFGSSLGPVTTLEFGPFGGTQALYYASYAGQVRRISSNNDAPEAVATADPTSGMPPLVVEFDGSDSTDPDSDALTYRWDFDDGSPDSTSPSPTHTFEEIKAGGYDVTLTVTDSQGLTDSATINIDVGNSPPQPVIQSPSASLRFSVGQEITLQGTATDDQGDDVTLHWDVTLRHDTHEHPYFSGDGNNLTFDAPAPEDLLAATNSYLLVALTATDETGLSKTVRRNFLPDKVQLTVESDPAGMTLSVEGQPFKAPAVITSWAGNPLDLAAPDQLTSSGEPVTWSSWSVPGSSSFQFITPADDATVTANFELVTGPAFAAVADARVRESKPTTNEGKVTGLTTLGGTSDLESYLRFNVTGVTGNVVSATLYLYAYDGTVNGPKVYRTFNTWEETTITWSNRPRTTGGALDDVGNVPKRSWVALDVTAAITGNGTFNFLLRTTSTDGLSVYSRESSSNQPRLVLVTSGNGSDTSPPSVPTGLAANATSSTSVDLTWSASTDDVGVTGYDVFRNGQFLTSVGGTSFTDTTTAANKTYAYRVRARDGAGNVSALSSPISETTPGPTTTRTYTPVADARVWESRPGSNYGSSSELRAEGGSDPDFESYLRFNVTGQTGTVFSATLRIFVPAKSGYGSIDGPRLYQTSTNWSESAITWNARPTKFPIVVGDAGAIAEGAWVEYDVTDVVLANGPFGFVLVSTSTDVAVFSSREGANRPQLVIVTSGGSSVSQSDSAPIAEQSETPSPTPTPEAASPALPFSDDFESGDLSSWTDVNGVRTSQSLAVSGVWSAVAASSGSDANQGIPATATKALNTPEHELFVRGALYIDGQGDNSVDLVTLSDERGRPLVTLVAGTENTLALRIGRSNRVSEIAELSPDSWHELQVHLLVAGNDSVLEIWLDGKLVDRRNIQLSASHPVAAFSIGDAHIDRSFVVYFDDVRADRSCIGTCSTELVTTVPEATPAPTEVAPVETAEPEPTATLPEEPTATPAPEPTATPTPEPTSPPERTQEPEQNQPEESEDESND